MYENPFVPVTKLPLKPCRRHRNNREVEWEFKNTISHIIGRND